MSRCFPFPPAGYEKKARTDDVDLLKKEKHKEKKHKKEKKDKEKREDKDRKEKDKSDGKHRDRKDKKDKSKEKKKDKEREREKGDKTSTSHEKKTPTQVESCNGAYKLNCKEREQVKDQNSSSNEKKQSTLFCDHIGENHVEKCLYDDRGMDKFVFDLCSRIKDEEYGSASQSTERSPFTQRINHDWIVKNGSGIIPLDKEKKRDKRVDIKKIDRRGVRVSETISVRSTANNIVGKEKNKDGVDIGRGLQNRAEEVPRIFEKSTESRDKNHKQVDIRMIYGEGVSVGAKINVSTMLQNIAGKEKNEIKGVNIGGWFQNQVEEIPRILEKSSEPRDKNHKKKSEDKRGGKRKDKHKEKKSHGKDKEREREKKKEEKTKIKDHDKVKDNIKNGHVISQNIKVPSLVPDGGRNFFHGQNTKIPLFGPDGDKKLIHVQDTILPPFVPDGDRNLIPGQNTKVPPFVLDGDKKLILGKNVKVPPFVPNGDGNLILVRDIKMPPSVPDGDGNLRQNTKLPPSVLDGIRTPAIKENIKKRKDIVANGFLHETNGVPNKKLRPNPSVENGRKLEPCQTPVLRTLERKVSPANNLIKVNNNKHKVNGKIESQPLSIFLKKPSSSSFLPSSKTKADQIALAPKVKLPHPDTKYLNEVLSVPKIEEWCDFDEEEWLFTSKGRVSISAGSTKASETPRVWSDAVQIELADVCALPYVIPY